MKKKVTLSALTVKRSKKFINSLRKDFDCDSNTELAEYIFSYFLDGEGIEDEKS